MADSWRRLHALADAAEPEVRRVILAAMQALVAGADEAALVRALTQGDGHAALLALNTEHLTPSLAELTAVLEAVATQAGRQALAELRDLLAGTPTSLVLRLTGGLPTAEIERWVQAYGLRLAEELSGETTAALRNVIANAIASGQAPRDTVRLIEQAIGLNRRQVAALVRYRDALAAEGVTPGRLARLVDRYAARLLRQRATAIARTETITAVNMGNLETWQRNVREGVLDPRRWMREWLAVEDDRLCPDCMDLDGQRAPLDQPFISPAYGEVWSPALHPGCRCAVALVRR